MQPWLDEGATGPFRFGPVLEVIQAQECVVLSTMWLAALPLLAAELWGLLAPRSQRAQALRVPFGLATALIWLLAAELARHSGIAAISISIPYDSGEI